VSIDLETELTAGLREHAAGVRLSYDVLENATRRHRRHQALRRSGYTIGVLGLAGVLATGLVITRGDTAGTPADPPRTGQAAADQPAELRLAAAVQATAQTSYRFTLRYTISAPEGRADLKSTTEEYAGAFDPRTSRGYLTGMDGNVQIRIIDGEFYVLRNGWRNMGRSLSQAIGIIGARGSTGADALTADPHTLLARLRDLGTVRHAGREGSVDAYTFEYQAPADPAVVADRVTGRVEVDAASKLIVRVTQETTLRGAQPGVADRDAIRFRTVLTLSDHGLTVNVD
jgi:hypothetical protein